jgi:hypothetical protein
VHRATWLISWYHAVTKRRSSLRFRVCQYAIASEEFGTPRDMRHATDMLNVLNIHNPEEYVWTALQQYSASRSGSSASKAS